MLIPTTYLAPTEQDDAAAVTRRQRPERTQVKDTRLKGSWKALDSPRWGEHYTMSHFDEATPSRGSPRLSSGDMGLRAPQSRSYQPASNNCMKRGTDSAASTPFFGLRSAYQNMAAVRQKMSAGCEGNVQHHEAEDFDIQVTNETIMGTTITEDGTMGCAFFSTRDNRLLIAQDAPLGDVSVVQHFLEYIQPSCIIVSEKFPNNMAEALDAYVDSVYQEQAAHPHILTIANSEFSMSASKDRLLSIFSNIDTENRAILHPPEGVQITDSNAGKILPDSGSSDIQYLRLGGILGSGNSTSIICAGVVVAEVNKHRAAQSQCELDLYEIRNIELFHLSEYLYINTAALSSLEILHGEIHPNSQMWHTTSGVANQKEGLSLYGMFHNLASTSQGRVQLKRLFLRPSTDVSTILARQQTISTLLKPQNFGELKQMVHALRKVPNMKGIISKLGKGIDFTSIGQSVRGGLWAALEKFSRNIVEVQRLAGSFIECDYAPVLKKFRETVEVGAIVSVGLLVEKTIDFEQSRLRERYSIQSGVDTDLDRLKRRYDGMESFLTKVVDDIIKTSASWARQYIKSCIFLPQLGFLLVVELDELTGNGKYSGEGQPLDIWDKIFIADGSVCYKTKQMKVLDEAYGDVYCQIGDREVELLQKLAASVLEYSSELMHASQLSGELDAILALALGAQKYGWNQPGIAKSGSSHIIGGRHPLHEAFMQHFIPNDFGAPNDPEGLNPDSGRIMVVTGPNNSGKSVYLKQVALITYLAHIGSFVPADKATIAITDKILVCMPAQESASSNESALATDLREMSHSAKQATDKSLVLVDEFGKGTCPINGAGLAAGLLDHFVSLGIKRCPQIIIATHFHEIFEFESFGTIGFLNFAHMKVEINLDNGKEEDPIVYLFMLQNGRSSSSFGEQCATMNGVPSVVVDRAGAISSIINRDEDLAATCAALSHAEQARLEIAEEVARKFLSFELGDVKPTESTLRAIDILDSLLS